MIVKMQFHWLLLYLPVRRRLLFQYIFFFSGKMMKNIVILIILCSAALCSNGQSFLTKYPKLTTNSANIYAKSDFYIFNGAYMRIKNITFGYTLPSELTKKFFVNKLRVYFSANDLPAFSKYPEGFDPEWGDRAKDLIMSSYIFGLNVSF